MYVPQAMRIRFVSVRQVLLSFKEYLLEEESNYQNDPKYWDSYAFANSVSSETTVHGIWSGST